MVTKVDGYIRVSRQGDRPDESFIAPELQRRQIEALCAREGLEVVRWFVEIDKSGADNSRPQWLEAISRVEQGKTKGIAVWNLSRFSRSLKDALVTLERIEAAGGHLYSASETLDDSPSGRMTRSIFFAIGEMERERAKDGFYSAKAMAIAAGKYAARTPFGYIRNQAQGLDPDPERAHLVAEVFERRARGESWRSLAAWLTDQGHTKTAAGVRHMIQNEAYLGVALAGPTLKNDHAHTPLVSRLQWDRAHQARGMREPKTGRLTDVSLLQRMAVCAGCGHKMYVGGGRYKNSATAEYEREPSYYCRGLHGSGRCPERAFIRGKVLDSYVEQALLGYLETVPAVKRTRGQDVSSELVTAEKRLAETEYELAFWASNTRVVKAIGEDAWTERLEELATLRNLGQAEVDALSGEDSEDIVESISALWPTWTFESKREFMGRVLEKVVVKSAHGRRNVELKDRIQIKIFGSKSGGWLKIYGEDQDHWAADGIKVMPDAHPEWNDHPAR